MTPNQIKYLKIGLSILFLLCLLDMPYGFFQLVRTIAMIGFGLLAYNSYQKENQNMVIIYLGLLILFQPIFKIALGRELWNLVDVVLAGWLLSHIFFIKKT